jgi:hypothetical protein
VPVESRRTRRTGQTRPQAPSRRSLSPQLHP